MCSLMSSTALADEPSAPAPPGFTVGLLTVDITVPYWGDMRLHGSSVHLRRDLSLCQGQN